ncbi:hypothetical protein [Nocardioides renjunii]|uniref:hypothetical protein n=1 Tax=Nocardioides renjunii TaxID=3095075 RepID=UPI002AFE3A8B|nr:hypothetical protein [Nocardioides sp. S-34]WQQ20369.1 hypothetical protein SHK17_10635 [Nocardioides sp. S-34]
MRPGTRHPSPVLRGAWSAVVWPVLAGVATALGAVGAYRASTVLGLLATFLLLGALTAGCLFCIALELAPTAREAARRAITLPVAVLAGWGLVSAFNLYGLLVVVALAATSPPVTRRLSPRLADRADAVRGGRPAPDDVTPYDRLERERVNRRFEELVSGLDDPGEAQER